MYYLPCLWVPVNTQGRVVFWVACICYLFFDLAIFATVAIVSVQRFVAALDPSLPPLPFEARLCAADTCAFVAEIPSPSGPPVLYNPSQSRLRLFLPASQPACLPAQSCPPSLRVQPTHVHALRQLASPLPPCSLCLSPLARDCRHTLLISLTPSRSSQYMCVAFGALVTPLCLMDFRKTRAVQVRGRAQTCMRNLPLHAVTKLCSCPVVLSRGIGSGQPLMC